jgi:apolipoprotein D and lipocalin family protein
MERGGRKGILCRKVRSRLLESFFLGPFYGSYIIFELDKENYQYAFVCGSNTSYLWLLSRTPTVEDALLTRFIHKARKLGFETEKLIYVDQTHEAVSD